MSRRWTKRLLSAMDLLGSTVLGGALYSHWPMDYSQPLNKSEQWKYAVEGIRSMSAVAVEYDVPLNMESLNRFVNCLINTAKECTRFVSETGCVNVWVMLDIRTLKMR